MTAIDHANAHLLLAQHVPSGETYVLEYADSGEDKDCTGVTYTAVDGPLHHGDWQDPETLEPRADWAEQDYNLETDPDEVAWANAQQFRVLAPSSRDQPCPRRTS